MEWVLVMFWLLLGGGILWVGHLSHKFELTGWDIRVVVEEGKCHWIQGVSQRDREAYESFFVRDLAVNGRLEVFATKESNGRLRMKVKGTLDAGQKQQLRNFLLHGT